jgi:signal transduction histidine kinase
MGVRLLRDTDAERLVSSAGRRFVAGMRVLTLIPAGAAAILAADGPGMRLKVIIAVGVLAGWSVVYIKRVLAGQTVGASLIDSAVLLGLFLATPLIVSDDWLVSRTSWLRPFVTFAAVGYQYSIPWRVGVGLGALLCFAGSVATVAAAPGPLGLDDVITGVWSFLTVMLARILWTLVVRAGRRMDDVLTAAARARTDREIAARVRADQRAVSNDLHDTAAATLLMVGLGWADDPEELRRWAKRDLQILEGIRAGGTSSLHVDLCGELRYLGENQSFEVVFLGPDRLEIAAGPARAVIGAVSETLANVRRHAAADLAMIKVTGTPERFGIEIRDRGRGFDPDAVPATRRGVRESIVGRLEAVGGSAEIVSALGEGTTVWMEWPVG